MSAIAGIIHFDGAPVDRQDLQRMSQALEPFGRDGEKIVTGAGFGLLLRASHITPEDRLDRQPITLRGQDRLVFQGRLDNRDDLIQRLGLAQNEARLMADSALVAKTWERWGREALPYLIGVFSIAYWNAQDRRLTLARSAPRGGILYVHRQGPRLYFASAPHGLFALPQIPRAINQAALGDLLIRNTGAGETLFQDISLVQNAHWIEYRADGETCHRYWSPDRQHRLHFKREEDAWAAFAPLFEDVMRSQLRSIHPVGLQMSGGLDSAAVAGQAARILAESGKTLPGYTRVPAPGTPLRPDGMFYNDERPRVAAIAAMHPNLRPHFVQAGQEPVLAGLSQQFARSYSTFAVSPTFVSGYQVLYRQAAADGCRVLLNGASGNLSFTYDGHARLRELLFGGRWITLIHELRALHEFRLGNVKDLIKSELIESLIPHGLRKAVQRLRNRGEAPWSHYSAIASPFAQKTGALERMQSRNNIKLHWQRLDSWERRAALFTRTGLGGADALQAEHGLDSRDPCGDRRLVEFCLALPDEYFLRDGIERRFARLGMKHLIPDSIAMDPTRGRQDVDWAYRMKQDAAAITQALQQLTTDPEMADIFDVAAMQKQWHRFDQIDWRYAPLTEVIQTTQGLMGSLAVGQYIRWFEGRNQ